MFWAAIALNKLERIVAFVRTNRSSRPRSLLCQYSRARVPFLTCARFGNLGLNNKSIAVFGQNVAHVAELGLFPLTLTKQA